MNILLIGCGNIGLKRLNILIKLKKVKSIFLIENNKTRRSYLKKLYPQLKSYENYNSFIKKNTIIINLAFVCTNPNFSFKIIKNLLLDNINIFTEKPPLNNFKNYKKLLYLANNNKLLFKVGYNLKYEKVFLNIKKIIKKEKLKSINYIRAHYLYGTVKSNNNLVGSLMDVGIHLFYLSKIFLKTINESNTFLNTRELKNLYIDDHGVSILKNSKNIYAYLHFSLIHWKNDFVFEINFSNGTLIIKGLPKWNNQTLTIEKRKLPSGKPISKTLKYKVDTSFKNEILDILNNTNKKNSIKKLNNSDFNIINDINNSIKNKQIKYFL